jgi:hypothetical protein
MREIREQLATARDLIARAQLAPEGERLGLLTVVEELLHAAAAALTALAGEDCPGRPSPPDARA